MYVWIKTAHVASVLVFVGGLIALFLASAALGARGTDETDPSARLRVAVRHWDRWVTLPALVLVWGFGFWAALQAGWFTETWLQAKLVFVLLLSGLHGVLAGRLRRTDLAAPPAGRPLLALAGLLLVSLVAVAVLAVAKPV